MATTEIHAITTTVQKAISYAMSDKVEEYKYDKDDVADAVNYAMKDKKVISNVDENNSIAINDDGEMFDTTTGEIDDTTTKYQRGSKNITVYKTITSTINCGVGNPKLAFDRLRVMYDKPTRKKQLSKSGDEVLAWHCIQNFEEKIDPYTANKIGVELAQKMFGNFPCVVSTHTNTMHTHNHIVFGAWGFNGRKHHNCNDFYKSLRQESDRLCKENGLSVLNHTKDVHLVKWKDGKGVTHYYEPTNRKNALNLHKFANANDYRNTEAYDKLQAVKTSNRNVIKSDIDKLLPTINSYEELLDKLSGIGYEIRDKKVDGGWLQHVAFKSPMQEKFTRDYMIDKDSGDYTRENLTIRIAQHVKQPEHVNIVSTKPINEVPEFTTATYKYGSIDIDSINENYRKRKKKHTEDYEQIPRGVVERIIIVDVKKINSELNEQYRNAAYQKRPVQEPRLKNKRSQYLLNCINADLRALQFVENKSIQSFDQIKSVVSVLYDKRDMAHSELYKIKAVLSKANESVVLIDKAKELRQRIDTQKGNTEYSKSELSSDMSLLNSFDAVLKQRKLVDPKQQEHFKTMVTNYNGKFNELSEALKGISSQIQEYDDCVYTIKRVDNNHDYEVDVKQYFEMKEEQKYHKNKEREDR